MIRDCYCSLAIISELKKKTSGQQFTATYNEMQKTAGKYGIVDLLEKALKKTKANITADVQEKIQEVLELIFDATLDTEGQSTSVRAPKSYVLKAEGYIGQVITENEFNHLVSVVKKERFNPDALREVNELRKKARKQEKFSL